MRVRSCYGMSMDPERGSRMNVTLDHAHAEKLRRMAEQAYTQEGTLARSLLSRAIDEADIDAESMVELLNGIPGALERAKLGRRQGRTGRRSRSTTSNDGGARQGERGRASPPPPDSVRLRRWVERLASTLAIAPISTMLSGSKRATHILEPGLRRNATQTGVQRRSATTLTFGGDGPPAWRTTAGPTTRGSARAGRSAGSRRRRSRRGRTTFARAALPGCGSGAGAAAPRSRERGCRSRPFARAGPARCPRP